MSVDINFKKIEHLPYSKKTLSQPNGIKLTIHGKSVNHIIVNTLRRAILEFIPHYAFHPDDIIIDTNSSVYNNDYMRLRLSNLPLPNIPNPPETMKYLDQYNILDEEAEPEEVPREKNKDNLHIYVDAENTSPDIMCVTSDDCNFYLGGKKVKSPYPYVIPIVYLKPKEKFKMSAHATLGMEISHARYSPVVALGFEQKQENEQKYELSYASVGQLDELEILRRACQAVNKRLDKVQKLVNKVEWPKSTQGEVEMINENHTIMALITDLLQEHKDVKFAGYKLIHPLLSKSKIAYLIKDNISMKKILTEVIGHAKKIYQTLEKNIK